MFRQSFQSKGIIELLSIFGIMATFFWFDRNFGLLDWFIFKLSTALPGAAAYSSNLTGVGFVGLAAYSIVLRLRSRQEKATRATLEKLLMQKDFIDSDTGVSNRLGFKIMLGELRNSQVTTKKSILACEIRNLDSIASIHGEETSTRIEALYVNMIKGLCRESDFAGRAAKGRFYLMLNSVDEEGLKAQVNKVLAAIKKFSENGILVDDLRMSIHLNMGMLELNSSKFQTATWNEEQILQRLDFMLHCSRSKGHEIMELYSEKMENSLKQRALVECELLDAIKSGQIVPYFQPFIDMKTDRVVGLEILARWEHEKQGFIQPDIFVHIAEEIGAMRELTMSMLKQACDAAAHWPKDIKLAFNLSPNELQSDDMIDQFFGILKAAGISPDRVEVEITENAFIEEVGEITEAVSRLKKQGITISIDDFGTGYANLKHLKMLPFDKIKIDQSFIRDMASNANSNAIVRNIIALGISMNLPTTAEGIELDQNRDMLQKLGCSVGQGYLYAKALEAQDVMPFIENYRKNLLDLDKVA